MRPNQGLIPPGGSETIQIILLEKDKSSLLEAYQGLGQSALDYSKDRFLVQSCTVPASFSQQFQAGDAGYDALSVLWSTITSCCGPRSLQQFQAGDAGCDALLVLWSTVTSSGSRTAAVANQELHMRHTAEGTDGNGGSEQMPKHKTPMAAMKNMSRAQLLGEVTKLRRKYDKLVPFLVNLTAERDVFNNTLEQTKRDLNREVNRNASTDNLPQNSLFASSSMSMHSSVATKGETTCGSGDPATKRSLTLLPQSPITRHIRTTR